MEQDIADIIALQNYSQGNRIIDKTISYLKDRQRFEARWMRSLKSLDLPCLLFWGDTDAVSPMEIPDSLATEILPAKWITRKSMKGVGHFGMLEDPEAWATVIKEFVETRGQKKN